MRRTILARAFLAVAWPAHAQRLALQIDNGLVTLEATSVPARRILAAWARVGGTEVVGAVKVTGGPLTLDIVLRNIAGFMAAPRLASATPGASAYDRIMILATSSAPAPTAAAAGRP